MRALVIAPEGQEGHALAQAVAGAGCAVHRSSDLAAVGFEDDGLRFEIVVIWVGEADAIDAALAMRRLRWQRGVGLIFAVAPWSAKELAWTLADDPLLDHLVSWPSGAERLSRLVRAHVAERDVWSEEEEHRVRLEARSRDLSDRNRQLLQALGSQRAGAVKGLLAGLETRSALLREHAVKSARYARRIAAQLRLGEAERMQLSIGALVHDVGMIAMPDDVLVNAGTLSAEAWEVVALHPRLGQRVALEAHLGPEVAALALGHHERWDGSGYPAGLRGEEIPLLARVLAVADAFAAMTSKRPWRAALPLDVAKELIGASAGHQFDAQCVRAFDLVPDEVWVQLGAGR